MEHTRSLVVVDYNDVITSIVSEVYIGLVDWVTLENADWLQPHSHKDYGLVYCSFDWGLNLYPGDEAPASLEKMSALCSLVKDTIKQSTQCAVVFSVVPEMIGACMEAMTSTGLVTRSDVNVTPCRVIVVHKEDKYAGSNPNLFS